MLEKRTIHLADIREHLDELPTLQGLVERGRRTALTVPLLHEGRAIGALVTNRQEMRPFTADQIASHAVAQKAIDTILEEAWRKMARTLRPATGKPGDEPALAPLTR